MSRKLKFRFWAVKGVIYPHGGTMRYSDNFTSVDLAEGSDWKVMQFTGLKDRNGVEIYEGDVVMCNGTETETVLAPSHGLSGIYRSKPVRAPFTVEWHQNFACWSFANSKVSIAPDVSKRDYEVIGNIYQNPALTEPQ